MGLASQAARTAAGVASTYGSNASGIAGSLVPFEQHNLTNPSGYSPQDLTAQLVSGQAAGGGATSGIVGNLNQTAAATNNYGGFAGASDEAARQQAKAAAQGAEGVAAANAGVKLQQQKDAAGVLGNLYGTDVNAQGDAMNTENTADQEANQEGFFGRLSQITGMLTGSATAAAGVKNAFDPAKQPGCWVAAELYGGWNDPRTLSVRGWIFGDFAKTWLGKILCPLYLRFGERTAALIRKRPILRKPFRALFDVALRKAAK
jgi:hypothetical protein